MELIDGKIFVNQVTPDGIEKVELKPDTERKPGIGSLLENFIGAASDKEVEFLKDALPTKERRLGIGSLLGGVAGAASDKEVEFLKDALPTKEKSPFVLTIGDKFVTFFGDQMISFDTMEELEEFIKNLPPASMMKDTTTSAFGDAGRGRKVPSFLREEARANGGRIGYQTGGVTESRTLPPEFVEAAQKTYLTDLSRQAGIPSITTATTQQPGETAEQFANRQAQAQQFQITKAGMAELAPQVAAQDALQAAAYQQAVDPTTGLGSFQPFLTKAGTAADAATGLTGPMTTAQTTAYTSPFQQQVIDTTLSEFDKQAKMRQNQLAASALGTPGAFGGGREGVQRAEFDATSDLNRARILADLRQRGFQQAQTARQQDLANQMGISQLQSGLGGAAQDFSRAQISGLGTLGAQQQAQNQAILDAQRQAAAMAVQDPRDRLTMFGQGIAGLTPMGAGSVKIAPSAVETSTGASPLMTALGVGLAGADIYGRIFGGKRT